MEYSNEFLARVFWVYAPEKIMWNDMVWNFRGFQDKDHVMLMPDSGCGYSQPFSKCKLLLIPLSAITDEDAVEVAKLGLYESEQKDTYAKVGKDIIDRVINHKNYAHRRMCFAMEQGDYLRSKGYDTGFAEIPSLIDAGLAIDKTTLNN